MKKNEEEEEKEEEEQRIMIIQRKPYVSSEEDIFPYKRTGKPPQPANESIITNIQ